MKFKTPLLILSLMTVLFACNSEEALQEQTVQEDNLSVEPTNIALVEIKGMSCEMGCGSEIRKGLKHSGAVASTQFVDFDADNETNVAEIKFDERDLSVADIKKIIEGLNDGQFMVGEIKVTSIADAGTSETKTETNEKSKVTMTESSWRFPNLLELLSAFVL